jgi:hypothetical protein
VVLALALLVVGGIALVNALTSSGASEPSAVQTERQPAAGTGESRPPASRRSEERQPDARAATPLIIRVTGAPTQVLVRVAGAGGEVLQQGLLQTGETRQFEQVPLTVVANNGGAVEVRVYGEVQAKPAGRRGEWFVPER